jgi:hypothetical protein
LTTLVMLSEVELPLAEAHEVETSLYPRLSRLPRSRANRAYDNWLRNCRLRTNSLKTLPRCS